MSTRQTLAEAMHLPGDSDTMSWLHEHGVAVTDEDTMSRAIHDIYCGITADHLEPNEKDRNQARDMIAALQKHST
ncbi:MAG TPA: hypothetical protein VFC71_05755 [Candidatus Polarisedimenticolia bacterium]|nr:hypothetical protein [Candidatus Polarisedimenticolia bacterium]